jgi:hypothetical protein
VKEEGLPKKEIVWSELPWPLREAVKEEGLPKLYSGVRIFTGNCLSFLKGSQAHKGVETKSKSLA